MAKGGTVDLATINVNTESFKPQTKSRGTVGISFTRPAAVHAHGDPGPKSQVNSRETTTNL